MSGPLTGVRVLDLSRILAGPWATQVLADYGADVVKVEHPERGDDTRHWGPPYLNPEQSNPLSAYFLSANRGKQSIALDITSDEGQAIIKRLLADSDVLVENFKVGGLKKYGLDYESVKSINPGLIYCSITGFGQTGPYAHRPGYDAIIQGMGGLMSITGEADDKPGGGPQKAGVAVADLMTGMYAVCAIMAALIHRQSSGEGQHIDLALLDTQVAWLANQNMNYLISGNSPTRQGTSHPNIVPYQAIEASDGYFMVAVGNDHQFQRFCSVIGRSDLAEDCRFKTNAGRVNHREALLAVLEPILRTATCQHWLTALEAESVPSAPINNIEQVFADPQIQSRNLLQTLQHPNLGRIPQVANPVKFSKTPIHYHRPPPQLGESSCEILKDNGFSDAQIKRLIQLGVVKDGGNSA